jgi:predicted house-cleaning noncanonical NTP pyrophosphatase (MazG superfamily)
MRTVYNKLVRDRIPELVRKQGKRCKTDTLTDAQYLVALYRKMEEELAEYRANPCIEELADLYEVVRAVAAARGYSMQDLEDARAEKERQRGAFGKRTFLLHIEE